MYSQIMNREQPKKSVIDSKSIYTLTSQLYQQYLKITLKTYNLSQRQVTTYTRLLTNSNISQLFQHIFIDIDHLYENLLQPKLGYRIKQNDGIQFHYQIAFEHISYNKFCTLFLEEQQQTKENVLGDIIAKIQDRHQMEMLNSKIQDKFNEILCEKLEIVKNIHSYKFDIEKNNVIKLNSNRQKKSTTLFMNIIDRKLQKMSLKLNNFQSNEFIQFGLASKKYCDITKSLSHIKNNIIQFCESGETRYQNQNKKIRLFQNILTIKEIKLLIELNHQKPNKSTVKFYADNQFAYSCFISQFIEDSEFVLFITLGVGGDSVQIKVQ